MPEFIDPVFAKTSPKCSFSIIDNGPFRLVFAKTIENERFGLVFAKTGSINSGTGNKKYG